MAVLTKKEILKLIETKGIEFTPELDQYQLQPHTVDLRLGYSFYIPKKWRLSDKGRVAINFDYLNPKVTQDNFDLIKLKPGQYFEILPKEFVIASSLEKIALHDGNLMAGLDARSSFMRRGLYVANGTIDAKYEGTLTFPITNNTDTQILRMYPGERICHLTFETLMTSLTDEEARTHGLNHAKYHKSTPYGLESRTDSMDEVESIKNGKIDEMKEKYKIQVPGKEKVEV